MESCGHATQGLQLLINLINYAKCLARGLTHHKAKGCFFKRRLLCTKQLAYSNTGTLKILCMNQSFSCSTEYCMSTCASTPGGWSPCVCWTLMCLHMQETMWVKRVGRRVVNRSDWFSFRPVMVWWAGKLFVNTASTFLRKQESLTGGLQCISDSHQLIFHICSVDGMKKLATLHFLPEIPTGQFQAVVKSAVISSNIKRFIWYTKSFEVFKWFNFYCWLIIPVKNDWVTQRWASGAHGCDSQHFCLSVCHLAKCHNRKLYCHRTCSPSLQFEWWIPF